MIGETIAAKWTGQTITVKLTENNSVMDNLTGQIIAVIWTENNNQIGRQCRPNGQTLTVK